MNLFAALRQRRQPAQGFSPVKAAPEADLHQTFILEPILTPSGLVDVGEDIPEVADIDLDLDLDADTEEGFDPVETDPIDGEDLADEDLEEIPFIENLEIDFQFESGYFTVGESGEVTIDYLFDGGEYQGELAIFSLEGMEDLVPGSEEFIQTAANRALSESELGYIVISDKAEGARFNSLMPNETSNWNSGDYQGAKTFQMQAGDRFGFMLVPKGEVSEMAANPAIGGAKTPLFSLVEANPGEDAQLGQLVDVTGNGNTFVFEDLRTDGRSDQDYNDIIFQVRGATGNAVNLDSLIEPSEDWRATELGQAITEYASLSTGDDSSELSVEVPWGEQVWFDNRNQFFEILSRLQDERILPVLDSLLGAIQGQEFETFSEEFSGYGNVISQILEDPENANILSEITSSVIFIEAGDGAPSEEIGFVFEDAVSRYGGGAYVGIPLGQVQSIGDGYIQEFDLGGAGRGAILYGDGNESAVFLAGLDWEKFILAGGVLALGYPTHHIFDDDLLDDSFIIDDFTELPTVDGSQDNDANSDGIEPNFIYSTASNTRPKQEWLRQFGDSTSNRSRGVTTDSQGNIYVASSTSGSSGNPDFVLTKYTPSGVQIWSRSYPSATWEFPTNIVVDQQGNIYTSGYENDVWNYSTLKKWDANGNPIWSQRYSPGQQEWTSDLAIDGSGNVYVTGHTSSIYAGSNTELKDAYIMKFASNGNRLWENYIRTPSSDVGRSVVTDAAGNVYIAGITEGSLSGANKGSSDVFLAKYNSQGVQQWIKQFGSSQLDGKTDNEFTGTLERNVALDIDSAGNLYLAGRTEGAFASANAGGSDAFLIKLNQAGNELWKRQFGATGNEYVTALKVDPQGNVYITGAADASINGTNYTGGQDSFVAKYNGQGTQLWIKQLGTSQDDVVRDLAIDGAGNLILTGYTTGAFTGYTNAGQSDTFVTKWRIAPNQAPNLQVSNQSVQTGQSLTLGFIVTEPDGDPIKYYRFFDGNSSSTSGYFTVNGVRQNAGQVITVAANQVNTVRFVGGSTATTDRVFMAASDGSAWSNWNSFDITTQQANRAPILSASNQFANAGQSIIPAFTVTDPDNDSITGYYFYDYNAANTSGYFTVNGAQQNQGFYVPANQLHTVQFVGGSVAGQDQIRVWASDGKTWGSTQFTLETRQVNRPPVLSASNQTVRRNQTVQPAFTVTDPDGDTITRYAFYDGNTSSGSGYFTVNGVQQAAGQTFTVAANQLGSVRFVGGSQSSVQDRLWITAYDGQRWGSWTNFLMTTQGGRPPVVQMSNQTVGLNQTAIPSFTVNDPDGDAITYYRFFDGNSSSTSGYFTVNGVKQNANGIFYVPANQLSAVQFIGGSVAGDDLVYVSATDSIDGYSGWQSSVISTDTAGSSLAGARSIQLGQSLVEHVSQYDTVDRYRFTITQKTRVNLGLTGMTGDADLALLNTNGGAITSSTRRGTASESLVRELEAGTYYIQVSNHSGDTRYTLSTAGQVVQTGPTFTNFSVGDASGDGTPNTVFQRGALRFNWSTNGSNVKIYARNQATGTVVQLPFASQNGVILANLANQSLSAGNYSIYATSQDAFGNIGKSSEQTIQVLTFNPSSASSLTTGDFKDNRHTFSNRTQGSVFIGRGGTDILDLSNYSSNSVTFNPSNRAVFGGTAFDWLRINSTGQEVYFQGYEQIRFSDKTTQLGITPNDPLFSQQWNLRMMDVPGAWRFTTGSNSVLLGNIDSGVNNHVDLSRITPHSSQSDDDSVDDWRGHGTGVQGIMAATANNGIGLTGINWASQTYVIDNSNTSDSLDSPAALKAAGDYADQMGKNIVVNNSWADTGSHLWSTGDGRANSAKAAVSDSKYADEALYIFSSGNDSHSSISYPARWAVELDNVISVGAVDALGRRIEIGLSATTGLHNYQPSKWGSNYGLGLTLTAPTLSPSTHIDGSYYQNGKVFSGTSAAAPNASGVASLVWSANSTLDSGDIKSILTGTANETWRTWGSSNSDNQYGAGMVDAEAAVRRSYALAQNSAVAGLFTNDSLLFNRVW
jgi:hypothetical protein